MGGVFPAGMLKPDGAGGDDHIPDCTSRSMPPQVPTRRKVSAPILCSSSMAIEAEGPPMPVEQTETFSPQEGAGVDGELPVAGDKVCIVKQGGYGLASARITGKDAVTAHIAGLAVNMKLLFQFFA